jgi:hypothetical protein
MKKRGDSFWIMGAGEVGTRAVERLSRKYPQAALTVVDLDQKRLDRIEAHKARRICGEAASYLETGMDGQNQPDWIIPAVPIHLAFEWVRRRLRPDRRIEVLPVPVPIEAMLPNAKRGTEGQLFLSYADFRCPDHCTEPYDRCTWTGKPRKGLLYKRIEEIVYEKYRSIVVRSHQLAPGVGGYEPEALRTSLKEVMESEGPVLYATASLCHGVVHAFRVV